jgi:phage head maturation protease
MRTFPLAVVAIHPAPCFVDGRPNFAIPLNNSVTVALETDKRGMVVVLDVDDAKTIG